MLNVVKPVISNLKNPVLLGRAYRS
jgi:hypothetical protein